MKEFVRATSNVIENLKNELAKIRTSRASAGILEGVMVPYYGKEVPIKSCATINIRDARTIEIHPWDKSVVQQISNAILKANLGLTPQVQGTVIRIVFPPLTGETRKQLLKVVHNICEEHKISIRNLRRKELEKIAAQEKNKEISKDERFRLEKDIQKIVDEKIKIVDEIYKQKESEIIND